MKLITIAWRDIPSQVIVKAGRTKAKVQLPHRFQAAIDRAAMRAGKGGSQAYLAAAAIDARYSNQDLDLLIKNNGLEPHQPTAAHIQS